MVQRLKNSPSSLAFTPCAVKVLMEKIKACNSPMKKEYFEIVQCLSSGKDQLAILKKIGADLRKNSNVKDSEDIVVLTWMFFYCSSQHPMRRNLSSMIQSICEEFKSRFIQVMSAILDNVLTWNESLPSSEVRNNVDTVSSLMENFTSGDQVIKENSKRILVYLDEALDMFFNSISVGGNPVEQTKVMKHTLVTLKTIIAVLQKCESSLESWKISNDSEEEPFLCINNIIDISKKIMNLQHMTLECRCTAAMIFPSVFTQVSREYVTFFSQFIYDGFKGSPFPGHSIPYKTSIPGTEMVCALKTYHNAGELTHINRYLYEFISATLNGELDLSLKLVFLHGLLVKLPKDVLLLEFKVSSTLFEELFLDELIKISLNSSATNILVLTFKTICLWIEQAYLIPKESFRSITCLSELGTYKILPHLLLYIDHHVDTVRHNVNAAIKACFALLSQEHMEKILNRCVSEYVLGTLQSRGQILLMINICKLFPIEQILDSDENLPNKIVALIGDVDLATYACDLYVSMCEKHWKEVGHVHKEKWFVRWIHVLYAHLNSKKDNDIKSSIATLIIPAILKFYPNIVNEILLDMRTKPDSGKVRAAVVFLKGLRAMKNFVNKTGVLFTSVEERNENGLWKGMIWMGDLKKCLIHIDDQVRLDALSLICSSVKTTDPIDNEDIDLLQYFITYNMNSENPSFRHQLITNFKKVCCRLFNHGFQIGKQKPSSEREDILRRYGQFLVWITKMCFKNLYDTAPYSQISTTLELISLLTNIFHENKETHLVGFYSIKEETKQQFTDQLVNTFKDTYDPNRITVIEIFKKFPIFCSFSHLDTINLFKVAVANLNSPKPDISSISAYYLTFLSLIMSENDLQMLYSDYYPQKDSFYFDKIKLNPTLVLLDICMMLLKQQLEITKTNLIAGCQDSPLYGVLFCVRMLFQLVDMDVILADLSQQGCESSFKSFIETLIERGLDIIQIVSPYVSNDAPEGYLCDVDLLEIFKLLKLDEVQKSSIEVEAHVARMLLVCCWRSMKEVSLLIGSIVSHFSMKEDQSSSSILNVDQSSSSILNVDIIKKIWDMFCDILLRSKHAGAYELASLGFIKLCTVLWSSHHEELRCIPGNAVSTLVNDLLDPCPYDNAQVTRRSAGLPFYLEALCITEPIINDKHSFKLLMKSLTALCEHSLSKHDVNKTVISLNILRAFFKNTKLREDVFPYISSGIVIAINGFASSKWAIRNSCTLLFSALMQRVFGVKKSKMTGREFFSKFPQLYSFLLEKSKLIDNYLDTSINEKSSDNEFYHPSLYPVLLLLSHLYPSTIETMNYLMQLDKFIPYIMRCGTNVVYKTRTMAARAIVPLISLDKMEQFLDTLMNEIKKQSSDSKTTNQNYVHGCLLQLNFLSTRCFNLTQKDIDMQPIFERFLAIRFHCLDNTKSFLIKSLYIDVLGLFFQNGFTDITNDILSFCIHHILNTVHSKRTLSSLSGYALFLWSVVAYVIAVVKYTDMNFYGEVLKSIPNNRIKDIEELVLECLNSSESQIVSGMLDLVNVLITNKRCSDKLHKGVLDFLIRISIRDQNFGKALCTIGRLLKEQFILPDQNVLKILHKIFSVDYETCSDELRSSVVQLCILFIGQMDNSLKQVNEEIRSVYMKIWHFLEKSCQADQSESCRKEAVSLLCTNPSQSAIFQSSENLIYVYFNCCVQLLKDSSPEIRDLASEMIGATLFNQEQDWFMAQPSVILKNFFQHTISQQLISDPINCTTFLISLLLGITNSKLVNLLNEGELYHIVDKKDYEVSDRRDLLKCFIVYEEGKENPYFDEKEICQLSYSVLEKYYTADLTRITYYDQYINKIKHLFTCNIVNQHHEGKKYIEKLANIF